MGKVLRPAEVLAALPHREPFRFIDEIREVDDDHIVAAYRFRPEALDQFVTLFTDTTVEFSGVVAPGERVVITGRKILFRHRKLSSRVEMKREDGTLVCSGVLSGMRVAR